MWWSWWYQCDYYADDDDNDDDVDDDDDDDDDDGDGKDCKDDMDVLNFKTEDCQILAQGTPSKSWCLKSSHYNIFFLWWLRLQTRLKLNLHCKRKWQVVLVGRIWTNHAFGRIIIWHPPLFINSHFQKENWNPDVDARSIHYWIKFANWVALKPASTNPQYSVSLSSNKSIFLETPFWENPIPIYLEGRDQT